MDELNLSLTDEEMAFEYQRKLHRKALKRKRFYQANNNSNKQSSVYVPDWYAEQMIEKAVAERTMEREG